MPFCLFLHAEASWPKKKNQQLHKMNGRKMKWNGIRSNGKHYALNLKTFIFIPVWSTRIYWSWRSWDAPHQRRLQVYTEHIPIAGCDKIRFVRKLTVSRQRWPMLALTSQISDSSYFFCSFPVNCFTFYDVLHSVQHVVCTQRTTNWLFSF